MYGTIARMKVKPSMLEQFRAMMSEAAADRNETPGMVAVHIYQMDRDPNELMMAVLFTDRAAYFGNANSSEQNDFYMQMVSFLESPPEWNDGEVMYTTG